MVGVAASAFLGLSAPADAHKPQLKGWTSCSDGNHVVLWQIGNDFPLPMTIASATATIGGASYPVTGYTSPIDDDTPTSATTIVPGPTTGTITLNVVGTWPDDFEVGDHTSVELQTDCSDHSTTTTTTAPTTTEAPTTTTTEAPTTTTEGPTTTTEAPTTTTEAPTTTTEAPTTTTEETTTSLGVQGSTSTLPPEETSTSSPNGGTGPPDTTPISGLGTTVPPGAVNLPRTGTDTNFPLMFAAACIGAGGLLALRRRRAWNR